MYLNDLNRRMTLRMTDELFHWLVGQSQTLGVTPSDLIRMILNSTMVKTNAITKQVNERIENELNSVNC